MSKKDSSNKKLVVGASEREVTKRTMMNISTQDLLLVKKYLPLKQQAPEVILSSSLILIVSGINFV